MFSDNSCWNALRSSSAYVLCHHLNAINYTFRDTINAIICNSLSLSFSLSISFSLSLSFSHHQKLVFQPLHRNFGLLAKPNFTLQWYSTLPESHHFNPQHRLHWDWQKSVSSYSAAHHSYKHVVNVIKHDCLQAFAWLDLQVYS